MGRSGTDIDALAVESATNNMQLNQLSDKFTCTICEMDGTIPHAVIDARMSQVRASVEFRRFCLLTSLRALVGVLSTFTALQPDSLCSSSHQSVVETGLGLGLRLRLGLRLWPGLGSGLRLRLGNAGLGSSCPLAEQTQATQCLLHTARRGGLRPLFSVPLTEPTTTHNCCVEFRTRKSQ